MSWQVPLADITLTDEDVESVLDVLRSGWLTMGPRSQEFEKALAEYLEVPYTVAVSSGTAALQLAVLAAGIGPGDEVIVPSFTFVATAGAVIHAGGTPVLCDVIGVHDLNLDPADVERRITERTKAVIGVHFAGYPAPAAALRQLCDERGLTLIEDAAQAIGARTDSGERKTGAVGELGCFSFFSKKQLAVGEGGLVATSDGDLEARVRRLRSHGLTTSSWDRHRGHSESYDVVEFGHNFRLDEARAALGLSRLRQLDGEIAKRRAVAHAYRERLAGIEGLEIPWDSGDVERSSHFAFIVVLEDREARDAFRASLADAGVQTTWYPAVHSLTAYRPLTPPEGLPRTEEVAGRHCALPMSPTLTDDKLDVVSAAVRAALRT